MIGNIQTLPWYFRVAMFAVVAVVVYAGFWYFVTRSTRAETKELNDKIAELLPKNAQAQIASQRLNEFKVAYQNRQEEYDELKALLPEQRELTMVLQGVQERARSSKLSLRKFMPKDDVQQDLYSGKRIDVSVMSSFASLRSFFDQMAHYQRIVSITNFEIKQMDRQAPGKTVEARFDLTAYYVSAEKLQNQSNPQAPKSSTPGGAASAPAK
ncbi:MAG: type 4a pilus biogenesis protein PilO [bacterium]